MIYRDRREAGRVLARLLVAYRGNPDVLVLALPRGGVPVGYEVSRELDAPLDVFIVRKLGMPGHEEYAMGAIASGGIRVMSPDAARFGIPPPAIEAVVERETRELERREQFYRGNRAPLYLKGRIVILVDDGLATGSTMRAAVQAVRRLGPSRIVVAVPVGARDTCDAFHDEVDEVICGRSPEPFGGVGAWYDDFEQTSDDEVHRLLDAARRLDSAVAG
jgi:putative phosphoribosyl transferase